MQDGQVPVGVFDIVACVQPDVWWARSKKKGAREQYQEDNTKASHSPFSTYQEGFHATLPASRCFDVRLQRTLEHSLRSSATNCCQILGLFACRGASSKPPLSRWRQC